MANSCFFTIKAVSKDREALKRFVDSMRYKDSEYFVFWTYSASPERTYEEGEYHVVEIMGDSPWDCDPLFASREYKERICTGEYFDRDNDPVPGTAHEITLDLLCKKLKVGLELYAEECGCCFQQHYKVNHKGVITCADTVEWYRITEDEDGNELDEPREEGGFDNYEEFESADNIY